MCIRLISFWANSRLLTGLTNSFSCIVALVTRVFYSALQHTTPDLQIARLQTEGRTTPLNSHVDPTLHFVLYAEAELKNYGSSDSSRYMCTAKSTRSESNFVMICPSCSMPLRRSKQGYRHRRKVPCVKWSPFRYSLRLKVCCWTTGVSTCAPQKK